VPHSLGGISIGNVESYLEQIIREKGVAHLTLFDPEKLTPKHASRLALEAKRAGTAAAMVGGSTATSTYQLDTIVRAIKSSRLPVILFPNDIAGLSQYAEPIPLGYLIVGEDAGAAGFIGSAKPIPYDKPELAAIYALAAQYMGMRFVYLEAGSGAKRSIPTEMVKAVKKACRIHVVVGGGIRTVARAKALADAGASVIVTGTLSEKSSIRRLHELIRAIR